MKNETTEATLFSWAQFVGQADEIERRRNPEQNLVSLRITFPCFRLNRGIPDGINTYTLMRESLLDHETGALNTPPVFKPLPDCPNPTYALSWGEWGTTEKPFEEGYFIWIASRDGWLFSKKMPRLLLPRDCFWLN